MKQGWLHIGLLMALLFVLNGIDYAHLGDVWNDGKARYLLLALVPISFFFFQKRLGFAPAFFGALALASWTINDFKPSHDTLLPIVSIFAVIAFSCVAVELGERLFGNVLVLSGVVQGSIALLQWARAARFLPFGFWHHALPDGLIGGHTTLAAFLVVCLAPALWRKQWWAVVVILPAALACQSRGGIVCLAALAFVYLCQFAHPFAVFLFALSVAMFLAMADFMEDGIAKPTTMERFFDSDGRFFMWKFGWRAVKEAPWFGSGIGAWDQIFLPRFQSEILEQFHYHLPRALHNDYLDFAVEYGLVPLGVLAASVANWARCFRPTWPHAVCAVLLTDACFSFPGSQIYLALPFTVCWAFTNSRIGESHGVRTAS